MRQTRQDSNLRFGAVLHRYPRAPSSYLQPLSHATDARWLYLVAALFATACTATPVAVCPEPVKYSTADQAAAAAELRTIPEPCILCRFMADYAQERAKLRVCK